MKRYELEAALRDYWNVEILGDVNYTPDFVVLTNKDEDSDGADEEVFKGVLTIVVIWGEDAIGLLVERSPIDVVGGMGLFANFIRDCPAIRERAYTPSSFGVQVSWEARLAVITLL